MAGISGWELRRMTESTRVGEGDGKYELELQFGPSTSWVVELTERQVFALGEDLKGEALRALYEQGKR